MLYRTHVILKCSYNTHYVGCTNNLEDRIRRHNRREVSYTRIRQPFELVVYTTFADKYKAYEYERYLKSGSGRAFAKRHLI
ncbi:MAG: GIY-YIG nuclease family protein [Bacteroidota bacterium]